MLTHLQLFERRKTRTRSAVKKNNHQARARLSVFRSNNHIYAQLIDDVRSVTLASASTLDKEIKEQLKVTSNIEAASIVGKAIAQKGSAANITKVVFDKGAYLYHGRVKALADAARAGGLEF
jgi:large subunit ribosomal protein L18